MTISLTLVHRPTQVPECPQLLLSPGASLYPRETGAKTPVALLFNAKPPLLTQKNSGPKLGFYVSFTLLKNAHFKL